MTDRPKPSPSLSVPASASEPTRKPVLERHAPVMLPVAHEGLTTRLDSQDLDESRRSRLRSRLAFIGFGLGIGAGFVFTAVEVALAGFQMFSFLLVFNLLLLPIFSLRMGLSFSRNIRAAPGPWKRPQLQIRTLMLIVAYVAFLLGLGVSAERLSGSARRYSTKFYVSNSQATFYAKISRHWGAEARKRRETVKQLRLGKTPDGLLPAVAEILRSLDADPKVTPEYRKSQRDSFTNMEERIRTMWERNAIVNGDLAEYHRRLAAKYNKARWRPWLPVEPDPPPPPNL